MQYQVLLAHVLSRRWFFLISVKSAFLVFALSLPVIIGRHRAYCNYNDTVSVWIDPSLTCRIQGKQCNICILYPGDLTMIRPQCSWLLPTVTTSQPVRQRDLDTSRQTYRRTVERTDRWTDSNWNVASRYLILLSVVSRSRWQLMGISTSKVRRRTTSVSSAPVVNFKDRQIDIFTQLKKW